MNVDKIIIRHRSKSSPELPRTPIFYKDVIRSPFFIEAKIPFKDRYVERVNSSFYVYKKSVWEITENVKHLIDGIELRGFKTHHIDHKISIWQGYKSNIPPDYIGGVNNLRMMPYKENLKKGKKSLI